MADIGLSDDSVAQRVADTLPMNKQDLIRFHSDRALAELDRALDAECIQAARAHFGLSALHLDKMQDLKRGATLEPVRP